MRKRPAVDSRLGEPNNRRKNTLSTLKILQFWLIHGTWGLICSLPITLLNAEVNHNVIPGNSVTEKERVDNMSTLKDDQHSSVITKIQYICLFIDGNKQLQ